METMKKINNLFTVFSSEFVDNLNRQPFIACFGKRGRKEGRKEGRSGRMRRQHKGAAKS
jgi:hypothetical protein